MLLAELVFVGLAALVAVVLELVRAVVLVPVVVLVPAVAVLELVVLAVVVLAVVCPVVRVVAVNGGLLVVVLVASWFKTLSTQPSKTCY